MAERFRTSALTYWSGKKSEDCFDTIEEATHRIGDPNRTLCNAKGNSAHIENECRLSSQMRGREEEKHNSNRNEECLVDGFQEEPLQLFLYQ